MGALATKGSKKKEKFESNWPPRGPSSGDNIELRSLINKKQVNEERSYFQTALFQTGFGKEGGSVCKVQDVIKKHTCHCSAMPEGSWWQHSGEG